MTVRNMGIDGLRVLMAFMIVALHTGALLDISSDTLRLLGNSFFRLVVPVFLIIGGYYFHDAAKNYITAKIWFKRLLAIYVFWMVVYLPFYFPTASSSPRPFREFILTLVIGYYQLWYLSGMLFAAVILYILRNVSNRSLLLTVFLLFAVGVGLQYDAQFTHPGTSIWRYRNFLFMAFPLLATGFLLRRHDGTNITKQTLTTWIVIGFIILLLESCLIYYCGRDPSNFDIFGSLLVVCPAIFLFFKKIEWPSNNDKPQKIASAIYFSHTLIMMVLRKYFGYDAGFALFLGTSFFSLLVFWPLYLLSKRVRFVL